VSNDFRVFAATLKAAAKSLDLAIKAFSCGRGQYLTNEYRFAQSALNKRL
jgi:hypothetical protein